MYPTEVLALRAWAGLFTRSAQHILVSTPGNCPAAGGCFYMCGCYFTSVGWFLFLPPQSHGENVCAEGSPRIPSSSKREAEHTESLLPRYCSGWGDTSPVESWISAASPSFPPFLNTSPLLWKQCWADAIRAEALKTKCWWSSSGSAAAWLVPADESAHSRTRNKEGTWKLDVKKGRIRIEVRRGRGPQAGSKGVGTNSYQRCNEIICPYAECSHG